MPKERPFTLSLVPACGPDLGNPKLCPCPLQHPLAMTPQRILLPTDFSPAATAATTCTAELARRFGADVHVLHVRELGKSGELDDTVSTDRALSEVAECVLRPDLDSVSHGLVVERVVEAADSATAILRYAAAHRADLIIMGTAGRRGLEGFFSGSVATTVRRNATCPVVTIRSALAQEGERGVRNILAPIDFSEPSRAAARDAAELAALFGATLHLFHVVDAVDRHSLISPRGMRANEADVNRAALELVAMADTLRGSVQMDMQEGEAILKIAEAAERVHADMVVMSSHGRSGMRRILLGSVAEGVANRINCPVWIARYRSEAAAEVAEVKKDRSRSLGVFAALRSKSR